MVICGTVPVGQIVLAAPIGVLLTPNIGLRFVHVGSISVRMWGSSCHSFREELFDTSVCHSYYRPGPS